MKPRHVLRLLTAALTAWAGNAMAQELSDVSFQSIAVQPPQISGKAPADAAPTFLTGLNYPWLNYGWDFGDTAWGHRGVSDPGSRAIIAADFADMHRKGVKVVRWFLFGDGRAAPEFDGRGLATGFDKYFYDDLDAALEIAQANDIRLILVLFDFHFFDPARTVNGVQMGGHANLVHDPEAASSLIDNALTPLFKRYSRHPAIFAWDIINEPEWSMKQTWVEATRTVNPEAMHDFVKRIVESIHSQTGQLATLGSAKLKQLAQWQGLGLDFYQYHDYEYRFGNLEQPPASFLKLDKPCILGEFPTKNTVRIAELYMYTAQQNGFAGALAWSYRAQDGYSDFQSVAGRFAAWTRSH